MSIEAVTHPIAEPVRLEASAWQRSRVIRRERIDGGRQLDRLSELVAKMTGTASVEITVMDATASLVGRSGRVDGCSRGSARGTATVDGRVASVVLGEVCGAADDEFGQPAFRDSLAHMVAVAAAATNLDVAADAWATSAGFVVETVADMIGRAVVVQDAGGREVVSERPARHPGSDGIVRFNPAASDWRCRTWSLRVGPQPVGRLWAAVGPDLTAAEDVTVRAAAVVLGALLFT